MTFPYIFLYSRIVIIEISRENYPEGWAKDKDNFIVAFQSFQIIYETKEVNHRQIIMKEL